MIETVGTSRPLASERPALRRRRTLARIIDGVLAVLLSFLVCWPLAWGTVTEALAAGGFGSARDLIAEWDGSAPAGGDLEAVLSELRPVLVSTVLLQALVIWLYEALATALTGSTPGKALARLRVTVTDPATEPPRSHSAAYTRRPWWDRALRMALRAALVVGPPAVAAGTTVAGAMGVPEATAIAEVAIALTLVSVMAWLAGAVGLHGALTGTEVVEFSWQQVQEAAQQRRRTLEGTVRDGARDTVDRARNRAMEEAARRDLSVPARRAAEIGARTRRATTAAETAGQGPAHSPLTDAAHRSRMP